MHNYFAAIAKNSHFYTGKKRAEHEEQDELLA